MNAQLNPRYVERRVVERRAGDPKLLVELLAAAEMMQGAVEIFSSDSVRPRTREVIAQAIAAKLEATVSAARRGLL